MNFIFCIDVFSTSSFSFIKSGKKLGASGPDLKGVAHVGVRFPKSDNSQLSYGDRRWDYRDPNSVGPAFHARKVSGVETLTSLINLTILHAS